MILAAGAGRWQGGRGHPPLAGARAQGAAHLGQRLGAAAAAEGLRRLGARRAIAESAASAAPRPRDHRERAGRRHRRRHAQAAGAAARGCRGLGGRLRHRLLLAQLPGAAAGGHAQDRPQLRGAHARRRLPAQHRRHDRFAGAHARLARGRRGRGGRRAGAPPARARLRPDPGLLRQPPGARGRRGRDARPGREQSLQQKLAA